MKIIIILSVILLILIGLYLGLGIIKTSAYQGPISDHFNGKEFYNLDNTYKKKSIWAVLKWLIGRDRQKWPDYINNTSHVKMTAINNPNDIRVTFVNHSTVLIQTNQLNFLTDPIWSKRASPFSWVGPKRVRNPGMMFADLPPIHVVLISHNHYDHLDIKTLIKLNEKFHPIFLVPLGNKSLLTQQGIQNVIEMDWWQQYKIKNAIITFLPTKHWSSRWLNDKDQTLWGSFGIDVSNKKIYFAGDTGYGRHFIDIKTKWGKPDIAFLPIGSYKPEWFMRENHLNPEEAVKAHLDLQSRESIAIHFNTFQLSDEAIDQPANDLAKAIKEHLPTQTFIILKEGESKNF